MPFYDFVCEDCQESYELRMTMARYRAGEHPGCPACGSRRARRRLSVPTLLERKGATPTADDCVRCCGDPRGCNQG